MRRARIRTASICAVCRRAPALAVVAAMLAWSPAARGQDAPSAAPVAVAQAQEDAAQPAGRIEFDGTSIELPPKAFALLRRVVDDMREDGKLRLVVTAYASGGRTESESRRVSLSRAIIVRRFMAERGIATTRTQLHPLGNRGPGPADHVELKLVTR